ncbi:MAG: hypothetical protein PVJ60_03970 [Phycisphaerales bacterium]|jgi:hypothetical protein
MPNTINKDKAAYKLTDEALKFVLNGIANMPLTQKTQTDIRDELEEKFHISINQSRVSQITREKHTEILALRQDIRNEVIVKTPIADKIFRLRKLQNIFDQTREHKIKLMALREARNEIGEEFDKLAEAIANSGGDNIVNLGILTTDPDELRRLISEQSAACGATIPTDRM